MAGKCFIMFKNHHESLNSFSRIVKSVPLSEGLMYLFLPKVDHNCVRLTDIAMEKFNLIHFCEVPEWKDVDTTISRLISHLKGTDVFIYLPEWLPSETKRRLRELSEFHNFTIVSA